MKGLLGDFLSVSCIIEILRWAPKDNAPQNFAVLRHIAINLLGKEKSKKIGIKNKQFLAAMDDNYLAKVLELSC